MSASRGSVSYARPATCWARITEPPTFSLDEDSPRKPAALVKVARRVPYRFATPEDLLSRARALKITDRIPVHDIEELESSSVLALRKRLRGAAVRYVAEYATGAGTPSALLRLRNGGNTLRDDPPQARQPQERHLGAPDLARVLGRSCCSRG